MRKYLERVVYAWAIAGGLILFAIVAVTSTNVTSFLLDRIAQTWGGNVAGLPGYEDFVSLAISAAGIMFFPYCQMRRGHVFVELFTTRLPYGLRALLDSVWLIVSIALAVFLAYWTTLGMLASRGDGAVSGVLGWPEWPFYIPGIVSLILWALVALEQLIARPLNAGEASHG